jgi:hypothetical protein
MSVGILVLALTATVTSLIVEATWGQQVVDMVAAPLPAPQPRWHVCTEMLYEAVYRGLVVPVNA